MRTNEDHKIKHTLELLGTQREDPQRDLRLAAHGKARFLAEARYVQKTVPLSVFQRLNKWMTEKFETAGLSLISLRKERSLMFSAISSIFLVFAIMLGGSGLTAYAAQNSLPTDFLYPLKLFVEDTRYTLTSSPEGQADLLVSFANNRVDEIVSLSRQGEEVPEGVMEGLQTQLYTMLQLAAGMDGEGTEGTLLHIREHLRTQGQVMTMLGQSEDLNPTLEQLMAMLENQHRLAEAGLSEPLKFQQMFYHNQEEPPGMPSEIADPKGKQNADCTEPGDCEPFGEGNGGENTEDESAGNSDAGNTNPGNADPGNADPGNTDPGNTDPGNADPGNTDPGNADPGNTDPGNTDPGNPDPGDPDPGNPDPGDPDPGNPDPGDPDPGDPDPGNPDPGDPDPGGGRKP